MADNKEALRVLAAKKRKAALNKEGFQAYTRDATPIFMPDDAGGSYAPDRAATNDYPARAEYIKAGRPPGATPESVLDTLKHELVHKSLINSPVPTADDYHNGSTFQPYKRPGMAGVFDRMQPDFGRDFSPEPNPENYWNWTKWKRAGRGQDELPAYMSIYNSEESKVKPEVRDLYVKNLMEWLKKNNQSDAASKIMQLIQGREAYNGTNMLGELGNKTWR